MFLSVFDIFKVGIGPSSSHTMGPMAAAGAFLELLADRQREEPPPPPAATLRIRAILHGSLAFTGRGHATDRAVMLGLLGHRAADLDVELAESDLAALRTSRRLPPPAPSPSETGPILVFDPEEDLVFDRGPSLPGHPNGLRFEALDADGGSPYLCQVYYSIGGGFIVTEEALASGTDRKGDDGGRQFPFPFDTAAAMLEMASASGKTIAEMKRANERVLLSDGELDSGVWTIWVAMSGVHESRPLLPRRAAGRAVRQAACRRAPRAATPRAGFQPHPAARGVGLAQRLCDGRQRRERGWGQGRHRSDERRRRGHSGRHPLLPRPLCRRLRTTAFAEFLLTAAAIGGLIKHNASISGADAGCQAEVGSAAAMAAAGLCAVLDGTPAQVENAAEIALEHHLGMTCDPVAGLVQVPCIERNGIGANKAVAAASLALRGDGTHFMPLDNCIAAMWETGQEMSLRFKETSLGGLAVNLPQC